MREDHIVELAWAFWLVGTAASLIALEAIALRTHRLPTLSRTLRRWLGVQPRCRWGAVSPFIFLGAGSWLTWHIARDIDRLIEGF